MVCGTLEWIYLEMQYNFISIMLGFLHYSHLIKEVILYGVLEIKVPIPHFPLIEVHLYGNERIWTKISPLIEVPHL